MLWVGGVILTKIAHIDMFSNETFTVFVRVRPWWPTGLPVTRATHRLWVGCPPGSPRAKPRTIKYFVSSRHNNIMIIIIVHRGGRRNIIIILFYIADDGLWRHVANSRTTALRTVMIIIIIIIIVSDWEKKTARKIIILESFSTLTALYIYEL